MSPCLNCEDLVAWYSPLCPACTRLGAIAFFVGALLAGLLSRLW